MSVTLREERVAYDNIAAGQATGTERTVAGDVPPAQTYGGGDNLAIGDTSRDPDNITVGDTANPYLENVG